MSLTHCFLCHLVTAILSTDEENLVKSKLFLLLVSWFLCTSLTVNRKQSFENSICLHPQIRSFGDGVGLWNTYIRLELTEECTESAQSCVFGCKQGLHETGGFTGRGSKLGYAANGCSLSVSGPEKDRQNFSRAGAPLVDNFGEISFECEKKNLVFTKTINSD
jgi:hypothetical protein